MIGPVLSVLKSGAAVLDTDAETEKILVKYMKAYKTS